MANVSKTLNNFTQAANEAAAAFQDRANQLARARNLLRPDEVAGDYDAARLLQTTLGGQLRPITHEDLKTFQANARALGKAFKGGITAKQIIDRSLKVDRDRANEQIRVAVIRQFGGGKVHFVTNAGPDSDVHRHHVLIDFADFEAGVASPAKPDAAAKFLTEGKIRCSCDCGRWTFWYSYIATIGKFNAGLQQLHFPKIRNPHLVGVSCKHLLRVLQQLQSPYVRGAVAKMIEQGRRGEAAKVRAVTKKDAQAMAKHQADTAHHKRSQIETTAERKTRLEQQRRVKAIVAKSNATLKKLPTTTKVEQAKRKFEQQAKMLAKLGGINQKMLNEILAKLYGKK